jgi:hypothetical protein
LFYANRLHFRKNNKDQFTFKGKEIEIIQVYAPQVGCTDVEKEASSKFQKQRPAME